MNQRSGQDMATDNAGIDPAVRARITSQIDAFEKAMGDAENDPSADALGRLRESADELMRALSAILLELGKQP